jgi:pyruvate dehydrogenase E1 component beta subunit
MEYTGMLNAEGEVPDFPLEPDLGKAVIRKEGRDLSLITYGSGVSKAMEAAAEMATVGKQVEVLDLRSLRPIDEESVLKSVRKTHRALIVEDAWRSLSISSEISARIMEKAFYDLDAPVERLCGLEVPIPYPKHLEDACVPQKDQIVSQIKKMLPR